MLRHATAAAVAALLPAAATAAPPAGCYDNNTDVDKTVEPSCDVNCPAVDVSCPAPCFCKATWDVKDVQVTDDIEYSEKYHQQLVLFEPPAADKRAKRPAVVSIHGGGFTGGSRHDANQMDWCKRLAARGYVCVSIDYRLDGVLKWNEATFDARAAVRWLRKNATELRVDTDRIGAFGCSAGAITVAEMTTIEGEGDSGNPGFSSAIQAGVSLSGALIGYRGIKAGQPPFLDFHGCSDNIVCYNTSKGCAFGIAGLNGVKTVQKMQAAGRVASIYTFPGAGHCPFNLIDVPPASDLVYGFYAEHLDLKNAECPIA